MKKLFGVITAMTTPFDERDRVDTEALAQQAAFLIGKGVNCLYPCGTTGEMYLCGAEERELIAKTVVDAAAGRLPVFIHAGAMTLSETIRLAQHAQKIGADGVGVVSPSYFTVDARAMVQYYKDVSGAVSRDFPVYAYVIPQLAHNDILPETMEEIAAECPNIVGVKYSYPDMTRLLHYIRVRNGDFSVVSGADHLFLSALVAGADGTVSGCSGPFPEPFVEVYRQYQKGDMAAARRAQERANTLAWLMQSGADMSIFKNILGMRGVRGGHMRKPLLDLTPDQTARLRKDVEPYL